jgi:hypothetical protein
MGRVIFAVKFKMVAVNWAAVNQTSRKSKAEENMISYEMSAGKRMRKLCEEEENFEMEFCQVAAFSIILAGRNPRKQRGQNEPRSKT